MHKLEEEKSQINNLSSHISKEEQKSFTSKNEQKKKKRRLPVSGVNQGYHYRL